MPEFELRQSPDERSEFLVIFLGKRRLSIFQIVAFCERWIEFRLKKGEEKVEKVYAQ